MSREQGGGDEERRKRLAAALRDNLKRRKAQDRARRAAGAPGEDKVETSADKPEKRDG
jgi:hypothetical protein